MCPCVHLNVNDDRAFPLFCKLMVQASRTVCEVTREVGVTWGFLSPTLTKKWSQETGLDGFLWCYTKLAVR